MNQKPKFAVVDGTYYIFRAFFGLKQKLTNKEGLPTNAIFGFKNMLTLLKKQISPDYVAIVFDSEKPSFRSKIYTEYKANRESMPQELALQIPYIWEMVVKLGYRKLVIEGYEADDVIASISEKFKHDVDVLIVSADKDLTQLVDDKVKLYDSMRNIVFDTEAVEKKYKVPPWAIADYLALMGDSSDNIPGAVGIGPVSAAKLLKRFGNIKNMEANLENIGGKEQEKLIKSWDNVKISRLLTEVKKDLPLDLSLNDFVQKNIDKDDLLAFYNKLNFSQDELFKELQKANEAEDNTSQNEIAGKQGLDSSENTKEVYKKVEKNQSKIDRSRYVLITTTQKMLEYFKAVKKESIFCLDLETTSLDVHDAKIVGFALKVGALPAAYIATGHHNVTKDQLDINIVLTEIKKILTDESITMIGQNIKYEINIFKKYDINITCQIEDTILQDYLLRPDGGSHSLDKLADLYLDHKTIKFSDLLTEGKKVNSFADVKIDAAKEYAAEDADVTYQLFFKMSPKIDKNNLAEVYRKIEIPTAKVLSKIEYTGVKVDKNHFDVYRQKLSKEISNLEEEIHKIAGKNFNINSPQQLSSILFEDMQITEHKHKTKTGFSTGQFVLEKIATKHEIAAKILSYRLKNKLVNTYLDVLPNLINQKTGRIHTSYNQTVAATGRLSSSNPNLQNIPIRGEERSFIRKGFIAEEGMVLISADYSQIELRVLAELSDDEGLIEAFNQDVDIHNQTAAKIFGVDIKNVDSAKRAIAKAINFGLIYGMGPKRLSETVNVDFAKASEFIKSYFSQYPKIKDYMKKCSQDAKKTGYAKTLFNRKRYIPYIDSKNRKERGAAERIAMNTPIQGTAADIIKIAMVNLDSSLSKHYQNKKLKANIIMQIHDELVIETPQSDVEIVKPMVKEAMQNAAKLKVPLEVNIGEGLNWDEVQK